jgi:CelD/BcsL family acetyltransferase involved in cellulose biosynthesis
MSLELQIAGRMRGALRTLVPAALKLAHSHGGDFEPLERDGYCAQCYRDWPDDPQFIQKWNRLLARNKWATAFCTPAWQSAIVDQFVPAGQFRLITVCRGDELLAVLPLALNTASMLETPGKWVSDYLDPLVDHTEAEACWTIILELLEQLWDWSVGGFFIHHVRPDSQVRRILPGLAPKFGFTYQDKCVERTPQISLPGTWEEYLARLDGHERKEFKRKIRNAETKANMQWRTLNEPAEFNPALERALEGMREAESNKADFTEEILFGFLRRICPALCAQGEMFIQELWLEGQASAWLLTIKSEQGPMAYNTSYDFGKRQFSPGMVSFGLAIRDAIALGGPTFTCLRGGEEFKKRLGAQDVELFRVKILPE